MIKVSILFICYNHSKYVAEALRSVLFQEYVNFEHNAQMPKIIHIKRLYEVDEIVPPQYAKASPRGEIEK